MKTSGKAIVLGCWLIVGVSSVWHFAQTPSRAVIEKVDITLAVLYQQKLSLLQIGVGLILAGAAFFLKKVDALLIGLSCMFYLAEWFPWSSVRIIGLLGALKYKWILACTRSSDGEFVFGLMYFFGQILVPVIFVAVIGFVLYSALSNQRLVKGHRPLTQG